MGTSGVQILQDDFAVEVREIYMDHLFAGLSSVQATAAMRAEYGRLDVDEEPVFWLSLALTQSQQGRLVESVRDEALRVIDSGRDLERWNGDPRRAKVLAKLRLQLMGSQSKEKRLVLRKPKLKPGDFFRFALGDQGFGFGRILPGTMRAFYLFATKDKDCEVAEVNTKDIAFVVGSTDDGFYARRWKLIGYLPLEARLTQPIYQFHQAVGDAYCTVFNVSDENAPHRAMVPEAECVGLEQWGAASHVHIVERLVAALEGKPSVHSLIKTGVTAPRTP